MASKVSGKTDSIWGRVQDKLNLDSGSRRRAHGKAESKTASTSGWMSGSKHRTEGKSKDILGAIKGDSSKQTRGKTEGTWGHLKQKFYK